MHLGGHFNGVHTSGTGIWRFEWLLHSLHVQIYAKDAHSMDMIRYEQIKVLGTLEMHRVAL